MRASKSSENEIWFMFGWPYETTACLTRLIYSGLLDELPDLKIITHHMGGMIPFFHGKISLTFSQIFYGTSERGPMAEKAGLKKPPLDYFKMLYADTALGELAPTRCGHDFFGTDKCVFATDAPFDAEQGRALIRKTIDAVNALPISAAEKEAIFEGNAKKLLRLGSDGRRPPLPRAAVGRGWGWGASEFAAAPPTPTPPASTPPHCSLTLAGGG